MIYPKNDFRSCLEQGLYLKHHGIPGQKWGVKNGPPYPIEQHRTRNAAKASGIMNTLSRREKYYLTMDNSNPTEYTKQSDYNGASLYSDLIQIKGEPVAVFDIWKSWDDKHGEISLATSKKYQGQGYAMKLGTKAMKWFDDSDLDWLLYSVHKNNKGSQRIAEKLGFKELRTSKDFKKYALEHDDYGPWQIWIKDKRDKDYK